MECIATAIESCRNHVTTVVSVIHASINKNYACCIFNIHIQATLVNHSHRIGELCYNVIFKGKEFRDVCHLFRSFDGISCSSNLARLTILDGNSLNSRSRGNHDSFAVKGLCCVRLASVKSVIDLSFRCCACEFHGCLCGISTFGKRECWSCDFIRIGRSCIFCRIQLDGIVVNTYETAHIVCSALRSFNFIKSIIYVERVSTVADDLVFLVPIYAVECNIAVNIIGSYVGNACSFRINHTCVFGRFLE